MNWFTNLPLLWKVLGVTLTVSAVTVGVGLVGYRSVQQTTADVEGLGRGLIPKVAAAGRMHQSMYEAVADLRGATLANDPVDVKSFVDGARAAMSETDLALAEYQKLQLAADEKRILSDYNTAHTAWNAAAQLTLAAITAPPKPAAAPAARPSAPAAPAAEPDPPLVLRSPDRQDETAAAAVPDEASAMDTPEVAGVSTEAMDPAAAEANAAKAAADAATAAADAAKTAETDAAKRPPLMPRRQPTPKRPRPRTPGRRSSSSSTPRSVPRPTRSM